MTNSPVGRALVYSTKDPWFDFRPIYHMYFYMVYYGYIKKTLTVCKINL